MYIFHGFSKVSWVHFRSTWTSTRPRKCTCYSEYARSHQCCHSAIFPWPHQLLQCISTRASSHTCSTESPVIEKCKMELVT
uniref:Uncharacterized protein n=1 Tax=Trichobilharzia regenti TaxID=157069 RepID=A0AA85JM28_TRIRE|nr:unnamed protein product [Trichobilharzia regenti]